MRLRLISIIFALLAAAAALVPEDAGAVVLDWSTVTWQPGSLSNTYSFGNSTVTITISGNTNKLTVDPVTGEPLPAINNTLEGGMGGDKSLHIAGDLSTQTDFIVTVSFGGQYVGATDVSFKIFDIDEGNDHDRIINNYATAANGLTAVAPTISDLGSTVQLTGSGLGQVLTGYGVSPDAGVGSANGNATISFGSTAIQSFTFDFKNTSGPPRFQDIGLFDLNFTPVPEMNPAWLGGLSCLAAGFLILRHNARVRK